MSTPRQDPVLQIVGLRKKFGSVEALRSIDLSVRDGEFVTILGASGSGKTTLLRTIAGFETPNAGRILIKGRDITWSTPAQRQIGMVFQSYALFPHLSVIENVMFPLEMRRIGKRAARERAIAALDLVHLAKFGDRFPRQLSGGQQQRVALARAIVFEPSLLLLDEPFSALDRRLREMMQQEVKNLQSSLGLTTIFITHDQEEALVMSDRIAVMVEGSIRQFGTPEDLYYRPKSIAVASFVGDSNILEGKAGGATFTTRSGARFALAQPAECERLLIRPEALRLAALARTPEQDGEKNDFTVRLLERSFVGAYAEYRVQLPQGDRLHVRMVANEHETLMPDQTVRLTVMPADCRPLEGRPHA